MYTRLMQVCCLSKCRRIILTRHKENQRVQIIENHSTQTRFARFFIIVINAAFSLKEWRKIVLDIHAHQTCNHQTYLTLTFMQVCCSRNINVKPVYLRSISVSVHILCYPWGCIRLSLTVKLYPAHEDMLLKQM